MARHPGNPFIVPSTTYPVPPPPQAIHVFVASPFEMDQLQLRASRALARDALERAGRLPFKPITSAKWVDVHRTWTGMLHVRIEHDTVRGCSPQMLRWWFSNLGRRTTWDGSGFDGPEVSFYHLWHHRDHIAITPVSGSTLGFAVGGKTRVVEQFNDFHEKLDIEATTTRLDDEEFVFVNKLFGLITVCQVIHYYSQVPGGSRFYSATVIGSDVPVIGWLINWCLMPLIYSKKTAENWIRHNIEETGRSEDVIPPLYRHYNSKQE